MLDYKQEVLKHIEMNTEKNCIEILYKIADCCFGVCGKELASALDSLYGFRPFKLQEGVPEFSFRYCKESLPECVKSATGAKESLPAVGKMLYEGETDGVAFRFYKRDVPGHLLEMEHEDGSRLYAWNQPNMRTVYLRGKLTAQMLRFALWIGYGLMTLGSNRVAIHGSCIVKDGRAYLFLGESGTGKSTHTRLWRENISGALLLNDDSPIVLAEDGGVWIYGSPWSGKTPCYRQERYPLCGCVRLSQAPYNEILKLSKLKAYAALHPSCPPEFAYDEKLYDNLSGTINSMLMRVPFYHLKCLPNVEAALLSCSTMEGVGIGWLK